MIDKLLINNYPYIWKTFPVGIVVAQLPFLKDLQYRVHSQNRSPQ